jgi:hypothetical protein
MIARLNGSPGPLSCRWILFRKRSEFLRVSNWTRALCVRIPEGPRVVSEEDCRGCTFWEPADTHAS